MAEEGFKLPGASLEELEKIIEAYSQKNAPASNDEIAKLAGSSRSTVSRCNGFLSEVNLIQGGQKKEATEVGRKLGLALHHGQASEAQRFWQQVISGHEFLSEQVTAVRVQKAIHKEDLPGKILYNSGSNKNKYTEIGSRTVTDILVKAALLAEDEGNYTVRKGTAGSIATEEAEEAGVTVDGPPAKSAKPAAPASTAGATPLQLAVNLQIQIQEFEDTSKYEDLFRALRKYLFSADEPVE